MSSPSSRIKIRCPNCQTDGSARAELLHRRVACKHCSHVFRVIPVEGDPAATPSGMSVSSASAIIPPLTDLDRTPTAEGKAQAFEGSLAEEPEPTIAMTADEVSGGRLEEELRFLRDQLDKARHETEVEARKRREIASSLTARTAEHAQIVHDLHRELEAARLETRTQVEAGTRSTAEFDAIRDELRRNLAELDQTRKSLETLGRDRDQAVAEQSRSIVALKGQIAPLEARLIEAEASRTHRDQLARELEGLQKRFAEAERLAVEQKESLEAIRLDRDRAEAARLTEVESLRDQLAKALASSADAAILRQELDEVRAQRDRLDDELETIRAKLADRPGDYWNYPSTELDIPIIDPAQLETPAEPDEAATVFDGGAAQLPNEADALRAELAELADQLEEKESDLGELKELTERTKAEAKDLRRDLYDARLAAEHATNAARELASRVRELEATPSPIESESSEPAIDPALIEAERKQAVAEALKGAWADFEKRLAETQARLTAANTRADLMEADAREAREQIAARERSLELLGEGSSMGGEISSLTSLRILDARGASRITPADAEARLELARQLAVDRKDKGLIDRIAKMAQKVKADLEARNYTLAETLVRGAEIETGLDPGGFSINGLGIFRASPTIIGSLAALAPAFDRVMRQGDIDAIRSTINEMKTILGDQVGLPEIRRPGRIPQARPPISRLDAFRLFIDALIAESWLTKPVVQKKPLPDTALGTFAALVEATCVARKAAPTIDPEQVAFLDEVIQACCLMLTRRQQPDGHFPFLDPRARASKTSSVVEGMVAQRSDAVKDGWVIHVDPIGLAQIETGACALALATAGATLDRVDWIVASEKAAEWAVGQPCLPNFVANAVSAGLVARSYSNTGEDPQLVGLVRKLSMGLLPGQADNGRWIDPVSAITSNHLLIIRALHDAWEAIPGDRKQFRKDLKASLNRAMASLLEECKVLGVPPQGGALRDLIRHRDIFQDDPEPDPRLEAAILDSAAIIQDRCHDGTKTRLGVAADQLAALMELTADEPAPIDL